MSGAHDVARDAAEKLYRDATSGDGSLFLDHYKDEIEIVAAYLGVEMPAEACPLPSRIEHTFEIWITADHEIEDHELSQYLGHVEGVYPGSQRARRVRMMAR